MLHLLIAGGDMRYVYLAGLFSTKNVSVSVCGFDDNINFPAKIIRNLNLREASEWADVIILPLPATHDNITVNTPLSHECLHLKDIYRYATQETIVCLGKSGIELFARNGIAASDYAAREDFANLNAVPTCEGAIFEAMKILDTTIFGSRILVTGFGRCARILALTLKSMGAEVTVAARNAGALSFAKSLGIRTADISHLSKTVDGFDIIFNSIPATIFDGSVLKNINPSCPIIDIASAPGCATDDDISRFAVTYRLLPGLPGKYSPKTAAEIIKTTVINIIRECGKDATQWI